MTGYLLFTAGTPHVSLVTWQVTLKGSNRPGVSNSTGLDDETLKIENSDNNP